MMTAERLIALLETYPPEAEVMAEVDDGPFRAIENVRLVHDKRTEDDFAILEAH